MRDQGQGVGSGGGSYSRPLSLPLVLQYNSLYPRRNRKGMGRRRGSDWIARHSHSLTFTQDHGMDETFFRALLFIVSGLVAAVC